MGKFDGILLASDWDGTFFYNNRLFEENIKALRYFEENGGKFTVCSGRYSDFLKTFMDKVPFNTYTICYNGAYIVDLNSEEVLYEGFCDENLFNILDFIVENNLAFDTINIYDSSSKDPIPFTYEEYINKKDGLKLKKIYKVLLRGNDIPSVTNAVNFIKKSELYDYYAVQSWNLSLEILKRDNAKGRAIRRLGEKIGAKLIIAVGDYENDLDMIKEADIGYAVGNAIEIIKSAADRVTVPVTESAIANIIYEIEKDIDNKSLCL